MHRKLVVMMLLVAPLLLARGIASAHAEIIESTPSPGEKVTGSLSTIHLRFSEPVANGEIELLHDSTRIRVSSVELDEPNAIEVRIGEELESGTYRVLWSVTSQDGDEIAGSFSFEVETSSLSLLVPSGVIVLIVGLGGGIFLWRRA